MSEEQTTTSLSLEKIKFFKNLIFVVFGFLMFYAAVYLYLGATLAGSMILAFGLIFTPIEIYLEKIKKHFWARVAFVLCCLLCIMTVPTALSHTMVYQYYFIPTMMFSLVLFDRVQKKEMFVCFFLPLVAWILSLAIDSQNLIQVTTPEGFSIPLFNALNFFGAFLISAIILYLYINMTEKVKFLEFKKIENLSANLQKANDDLKSNQDLLKNIFASMVEGVISYNSHGQVIDFNPAATRILGVSEAQLLGHSIIETKWRTIKFDGGPFAREEFPFVVALKSGKPVKDVIMGLYHPDGSLRWIRINSVPLFASQPRGAPTHAVSTFVDITSELSQRSQIELHQAKLAESSKMAALGEMAAGIAHEINNPLAIISGRSSMLLSAIETNPQDLEKIKNYAMIIQKTIHAVAKIIKGLRVFTRSAESDPKAEVLLEVVVEDTLIFCQERFANHNVNLDVEKAPEVKLLARPTQISQVLLNLLNNSFDAIEERAEKWIRVRFEINSNKKILIIKVTDSGDGIPNEIVHKMMNPFFTTKDIGKGTGLGLSISKGIIEEHGGHLIYNAQSKNTEFVVELPILA